MNEPGKKTTRQRTPRQMFPVEVTLRYPGRKSETLNALWHQRDGAASVFGLPETKRPYMKRTLRIPDSAGVIMELVELALAPAPLPSVPEAPTPGEYLRGAAPVPHRPLRGVVTPGGPASEAVDENGTPIVLPAAFGMMPG